jgi:hypothetical protein
LNRIGLRVFYADHVGHRVVVAETVYTLGIPPVKFCLHIPCLLRRQLKSRTGIPKLPIAQKFEVFG